MKKINISEKSDLSTVFYSSSCRNISDEVYHRLLCIIDYPIFIRFDNKFIEAHKPMNM